MTLPMVALQAACVSLALLVQVVLELDLFRAQSLSGPVIVVGLLRELGPLTVGLSWMSVVAAFISQEQQALRQTGWTQFLLVRYVAAIIVTCPLIAIGTAIGFLTAALAAPLLGVTSTADFVERSRQSIASKDVMSFLFKLFLVNPMLAVVSGTLVAARSNSSASHLAARAVMLAIVAGSFFNWLVTALFYL